jgi:hypothetical protein
VLAVARFARLSLARCKEGAMPVKTQLSGTPAAAADGQTLGIQDPERTAGSQDPDIPTAGEQTAAEHVASGSTRVPSAAERLVAERIERRRQRAVARDSSTARREPGGAQGGKRAARSPSALSPPGRQTPRESRSAAVMGMLVAGTAFGAILGALSVAGWLIGLLVAGLMAILATVLRPRSRST